MKQKHSQSIDGFGLRRRGPQRPASDRLPTDNLEVPGKFLNHDKRQSGGRSLPEPTGLMKSSLDESLRSIDQEDAPKKRRRSPFRRIGRISKKKVFIALVLILVAAGGYFAIKTWIASGNIFSGNIFALLGDGTPLKADENGRSNILVFGTSEDDKDHDGAALTDSIMVLSVHQEKKNAYMVSVPRDLWVEYQQPCLSGYEGKINVVYECYSSGGKEVKKGAEALQRQVGETLGLDIHYYAKLNYTAVKDLVDAVGGVTVEIDSDDPRGILDRNFDWKCNYACYYVKWPNGPAKLNGEQALALARARNAAGGYGLGGGNFDREKYQQKIMVALRDKADDAGTLANPVAVNGIIDALGNNVRTSFDAGEVKTLIKLAGAIESKNIKSINLIDEKEPVLTTGNYYGQSIVQPLLGIYDFSQVHQYVARKMTSSGLAAEGAVIEVLNGSDRVGVAGKKANELADAGFIGVTTGDTPTNNQYEAVQWYDLSDGAMPKSAEKLKKTLGMGPAGSALPSGVYSDADFVIILGNGVN